MLAVAAIAVFSVLAEFWMGSRAWAVVSAVILVMSLNRFFFASEFSLDDEGITARWPFRRQKRRWDEIRRFDHGRHGGTLSRRAVRNRLDSFQAMPVLFGRDSHDVVSAIRTHLGVADHAEGRR